MARAYSDHFTTTGVSQASPDLTHRPSAGLAHPRMRRKRAKISALLAGIGDEGRMMQFKSSDRIYTMVVTGNGGSTAGAADLGLYLAGAAHDGAVVDAALFASALVTSSAIARVDHFTESTTLVDLDRGRLLWRLADIGAATYTEDPKVVFEIVFTATTGFTVANTILMLEVDYVSGD